MKYKSLILIFFIFKINAEEIDFKSMQSLLQNKINTYNKIKKDEIWNYFPKNLTLRLGEQNKFILDLKIHLIASGEYKKYNYSFLFDQDLSKSISQYQENNNLKITGNLNNETINKLNEPINNIINSLSQNLNRIKKYNFNGNYILINIPFFKMSIVYNSNSIYEMQVIVGKPKTQSCVLDSKISSIVLNPSWYIPSSIAKNEMFSKIVNNPKYFEKHNIKIIKDEKQMEIEDVSFEDYSSLNFVQSPGYNNALGKVKFVFSNDCGIYLHDTNQPNLFHKNFKGLSHGCIRLSNPEILSRYLLQYNNFNDEEINKLILLEQTKTINLKNPMDIHIIYINNYVNTNNEIIYRDDIYQKNKLTN